MGQTEKDQLGRSDREKGTKLRLVMTEKASLVLILAFISLQRVWEAADRSTRKGDIDGQFCTFQDSFSSMPCRRLTPFHLHKSPLGISTIIDDT